MRADYSDNVTLSDRFWEQFDRDGIASLGRVVSRDEAAALAARADDLALGRVVDDRVQFQMDTGGDYDALPDAVGRLPEATLRYRKIQGLEHDELFRRVMTSPVVRDVCARMYGAHTSISVFRAMIMNKPALQGTVLPWHQDAGDVWGLDRDPVVTLWLALDDATPANGCMEVVPGTHRRGLLSRRGSTLSADDAERHCPPAAIRSLPAEAGEMLLLHNWSVHRSGVNSTDRPRRAFTTCLMDARTISVSTGDTFPILFGDAPDVHPHVAHLRAENAFLRTTAAASEEYALSLASELEKVRGAYEALVADR